MKICYSLLLAVLINFNAATAEINAENLNLTPEQNQKILQLKEDLKAEIQPMWEEIESNKRRIMEIEKSYFEKFWNTLTEEQKQKFADLNRQ